MASTPESEPEPAGCSPVSLAFPSHRLTLLDLPNETQKEIFSHCQQCDLICLSLVCKHFRELAASQLYRNFHIVFPDEDDPSFDSPIDGLASGLDTFVTSEYNYAQHLRDLSLDTLSAGSKAEAAYKAYLYSLSCGKFMNTLLLLTLRKALFLETFTWNIRVELSRQVYKALHQIPTLQHLKLRMQAGPTLYEPPPPLPYHNHNVPASQPWIDTQLSGFVASSPPIGPVSSSFSSPTPTSAQASVPPTASFSVSGGYSTSYSQSVLEISSPSTLENTSSALKPSQLRPPKKLPMPRDPPTLSRFLNLKTLCVLDIDSLDIIPELEICLQNCAATLTKLKISFSDALAGQARKPPPEVDPNNDSDEDDEFQVPGVVANQHIPDDMTGPAKIFRAAQMRTRQEGVLATLFNVENLDVSTENTTKSGSPKLNDDENEGEPPRPSGEQAESINPNQEFINSVRHVTDRLSSNPEKNEQDELLDLIFKATKRYLESQQKPQDAKSHEKDTIMTEQDSDIVENIEEGTRASDKEENVASSGSGNGLGIPTTSALPSPRKDLKPPTTNKILVPFLLDSGVDEQGVIPESSVSTTNIPCDEFVPTHEQGTENQQPSDGDRAKPHQVDSTDLIVSTNKVPGGISSPQILRASKKSIEEAKGKLQDSQNPSISDIKQKNISDYVRSTRGIGLESLGFHQIPIKAWVLSKALDFRSLRRITLLNVGNQAPLWLRLMEQNRVEPLPLAKIFTDNVSPQFLTFVSQLQKVDELFMLERSSKHKPESFAPKTTVTIRDIRRTVLKKHLPNLKRLMIKNDSDIDHEAHHDATRHGNWDVDEKTMLQICTRGRTLQELSMSASIKSIHTMLQNIGELRELRALHIQKFRNEDTCVWVMRETRKFVRDNLTHYPDMKLEWLCIDEDRVDRIIRHAVEKTDLDKGKGKGKGKASVTTSEPPAAALGYQMLSTDNLNNDDESSDDDMDDREIQNLKIEFVEGIPFYDIWGVQIFKKEIMDGTL